MGGYPAGNGRTVSGPFQFKLSSLALRSFSPPPFFTRDCIPNPICSLPAAAVPFSFPRLRPISTAESTLGPASAFPAGLNATASRIAIAKQNAVRPPLGCFALLSPLHGRPRLRPPIHALHSRYGPGMDCKHKEWKGRRRGAPPRIHTAHPPELNPFCFSGEF